MEDKSYVLFSDSCCDLPEDLVEEIHLQVAPLSYVIKGKDYLNYPDHREMDNHVFFDLLRSGEISKTSQVTPGKYLELMEPFLKEGKDILIVAFSTALSGAYGSAVQAANYLEEIYPSRTIKVLDSLCASSGQGYLVYSMGLNKLNGMSLSDNLAWGETHRLHIAHWFTIDSLQFLRRGGRLSAGKAWIGTLLSLKPVLHVNDIGQLVPVESVRGRKQSLLSLMQHFDDTAIDPEKNFIMIVHGDDLVTAHYLGEKLQEKYNIPRVIYCDLGPVIGSHAGPNTISLFFLATER